MIDVMIEVGVNTSEEIKGMEEILDRTKVLRAETLQVFADHALAEIEEETDDNERKGEILEGTERNIVENSNHNEEDEEPPTPKDNERGP